jgi:hypothetical protein
MAMTNKGPTNSETGETSNREKAIAQNEAEAKLSPGEFDQLVTERVEEIILSALSDPTLTQEEAFTRLMAPLV